MVGHPHARTHIISNTTYCGIQKVICRMFQSLLSASSRTVVSRLRKMQYRRTPVSAVHRGPKKIGKLKKTVHKFQNSRQARTGRRMVNSSSPNASSAWFIFLCPRTHASPQTCHHSASSVLAVGISCRVITVFMFIKQQEEWRSRWIPTIGSDIL
jgi:hypothetical protein